jgi:hypothetical protein
MSCILAMGRDDRGLIVYGAGTTEERARQDVRARLGDHADLDALEYLLTTQDVDDPGLVGSRPIDRRSAS